MGRKIDQVTDKNFKPTSWGRRILLVTSDPRTMAHSNLIDSLLFGLTETKFLPRTQKQKRNRNHEFKI